MTIKSKQLINEALALSPVERIAVVDNLLISLDKPDQKIDSLWKREVEKRLAAHKSGKIKATSIAQALSKYRHTKVA